MVLAVFRGHKVDGFVLGTKQPPNVFITPVDEEGTSNLIVNPYYKQ